MQSYITQTKPFPELHDFSEDLEILWNFLKKKKKKKINLLNCDYLIIY